MITDDTIAAISTAAGSAARAIVRLSGPEALAIAAKIFTPFTGKLEDLPGFRSLDGLIQLAMPNAAGNPQSAIRNPQFFGLPARVYVFRTPRSYTRQDICELHVPGAAAVATAVLEALLEGRARQAQAGEFTARAFYSGRIDLSAAEAVADVIHAADDATLRSGLAAMGGRTFRFCHQASEELAEALATVEASIDLADEEIHLEKPSVLAVQLLHVANRLADFAASAADLAEATEQPRVAIAGRPNVGKSSLLNAMAGVDRAIVSSLAGTTRDVLSTPMALGGTAIVLQDAAGFAAPAGTLDALGQQAARAAVAAADAILFVTDLADPDDAADAPLLREIKIANPSVPLLHVGNKADVSVRASVRAATVRERTDDVPNGRSVGPLAHARGSDNPQSTFRNPQFVVSAVTGLGLDELKVALADTLHLSAGRGGEALGLHLRQKRCLVATAEAAARAAALLAPVHGVADIAELAAIELRAALAELGQISGQVVTEDVLGRIFARFCVGK